MAITSFWKTVLTWTTVLLLLILAINFLSTGAVVLDPGSHYAKCPHDVRGNPEATTEIKYFMTPYCVYCLLQKPIHKEFLELKGDKVRFEVYDYRYCKEEVQKYNILGVPSHVFNEKQRFTGPMELTAMLQAYCSVSGDCYAE